MSKDGHLLLKEIDEYFGEIELPNPLNYPESFKYYLRVYRYAKCGTIEKRSEKTQSYGDQSSQPIAPNSPRYREKYPENEKSIDMHYKVHSTYILALAISQYRDLGRKTLFEFGIPLYPKGT